MADWNEYFSKTRPPSNLEEAKRTIQDFAYKHKQLGRNIVLVTVRKYCMKFMRVLEKEGIISDFALLIR